MYASDYEGKRRICEYGRRMYDHGLVVGTAGNISCRVSDNAIWTTPTGVCKGYMTPDMLVKMDLHGNILEKGALKPSSETKMHLTVYRENPEVQGVVHAHPVYASAFAVIGQDLTAPVLVESMLIGERIPVAPYAMPGTAELANAVAPYCQKYWGCLLANHGAITWGKSIEEAFFNMEMLENYCQILAVAKSVGTPSVLAPGNVEKLKVMLGVK